MITRIPKTYGSGACGNLCTVTEIYCLSTDEKPTEGVKNADILYLMDWHDLTAEQQTAAVAQVWIYDAENQLWRPQ